MHIQNSTSKFSARPDLATNLLQFLIPNTFDSLLCQKTNLTLQPCPKRWFVRKMFGCYPQKVKIENSLWKRLPLPMQKGGFHETACLQDRQDRSWLSPCLVMQTLTLSFRTSLTCWTSSQLFLFARHHFWLARNISYII